MSEHRLPKRLLYYHPRGRRDLGRAHRRWTDQFHLKFTDCLLAEEEEDYILRVDEERMMLKLIRKRKRNWLGHWLRRNCFLNDALEGMVNGRRLRGRRRYQIIDDIKIYGSYEETKRKAENRKDWRMLSLQ
ncbi:hypothetical protein ANN_05128 [Periplaneta americana]|uniref:Uncharacterized protein n=1 Tax=Periplaneta americana TaxID=6978 RepID=A0ABQ8TAA0_PERAM|nr:hypothetical protein ANN_05128 [Periplaneta americana]